MAQDVSNESSEVFYTPEISSQEIEETETLEQIIKKGNVNHVFNEDSFHDIMVSLLDSENLTDARFVRVLFSIAPRNYIRRKTLDYIFAKILVSYKTQKSHAKIKGLIHYLIGLLKFKIIDRHDIRGQYPFYYTLIETPELEESVSELIYLTTTYDNIKPWYVQKIQRLYQRPGKQEKRPHLLALLQLFKRIKINIVTIADLPEVPNEIQSFPEMKDMLKKTLAAVRHNMKPKMEIAFPQSNVNQVAVRSNAYDRHIRSFQQFHSLSEFLESYKYSSYDMYETCYDSILGNKLNFVLLGILRPEEKEQVKLYVQHIWDRIEQNEMSDNEIKDFLQNLYQINMIFDQNVFDIRERLHYFLQSYDFFHYSKAILQLVTIDYYPSYESFFYEILSILYHRFILAADFKDIPTMSNIIAALSEFLYNNYKTKSESYDPSDVFNQSEEHLLMSDLDLSVVIEAVQHLCKVLINVGPGNFQVMLTVLQFYERLNAAENLYKLNTTNVIPFEISYAFLVNPNIIILDRFAALINELSFLGEKYELSEHHPTLTTIAKQARDLYFFMFRNPLETSLFQQLIVRHSSLYRKILFMNIRRLYVIKHNLAFLHLTRLDSGGNLVEIDRIRIHLKKFSDACPHLMNLLTTIKTTFADKENDNCRM